MRLEADMRRLFLTTASVIAIGFGLTFAGTTQANAWQYHATMHSGGKHMSRAEISDIQQKLQAEIFIVERLTACSGHRPGVPLQTTRSRTVCA
jgi:hypothetical protein